MSITFGTDGWRGIIADDFTFANVALVARAAARFFKRHPKANKGVVVGYDARFLSDRFAELTARVFASAGVPVLLTDRIASTPQVSLAARSRGLAGGVMLTASHNPMEYNGFKLKAAYGGPSSPDDVAKVQRYVSALEEHPLKRPSPLLSLAECRKRRIVRTFDARSAYVAHVKRKIDFASIRNAGFRVLYDPMHGSGIHTMHLLLDRVDQLHNEFNPSFGDLDHPEPLGEYLPTLLSMMSGGDYSIGLATDGDADRLGVVDEHGVFVDSHRIFVLLMKYLYEDRRLRGAVAKTVSLTGMIDMYCERHRIRMHETKVGFKYIAHLMTTDRVVIGGEESGGLGTALHIPERDGIFNGLLLMEMMARRKKTIGQLSRELDAEFGPHRYARRDVKMTTERKEAIVSHAARGVAKLGRHVVRRTVTLDGFKFFVDGGWLLIRASGTEPLLRYYAEAQTETMVAELLDAGQRLG